MALDRLLDLFAHRFLCFRSISFCFSYSYVRQTNVGFGGGSDCANMGSGAAMTVVGGWKVSLTFLNSFSRLRKCPFYRKTHLPRGQIPDPGVRYLVFYFVLIVAKITKIVMSCNICVIAYVAELN